MGKYGRREGIPVGLAEREIHYLPPRSEEGHLWGVDGVSTTLNFAFIYIFRHFYLECARLPVTI